MIPLDPTAIMAEHQPLSADDRYCSADWCRAHWPCEPYRLADALDAERAKVAQYERPARVDIDAILATIPEDDPGEDPWGGANLERP